MRSEVENRDKIKIDKEKVSIVSWINGIYIFTNRQEYVYIIYVLRSIHIVIYKRIIIISNYKKILFIINTAATPHPLNAIVYAIHFTIEKLSNALT